MARFVDFESGYGTQYTLAFVKQKYSQNGNLAIEVPCREKGEDYWEPYGTLTVNLGETLPPDTAYLDVNNMEELAGYFADNGWIESVISTRQSGFVVYPLVKFSDEFMRQCLMSEEEFIAKRTQESKRPAPGESLDDWIGRVAGNETSDTIQVYLPIPSRGLSKERPNQIARDLIERVFANEGIEVSDITIIPQEDEHIMGTGAYVKVPIERYYDAGELGWSIAREIKRVNDKWSNVDIGNIGLEKKPSPSQASERKDVEMAEEVKKEFVNVEFPASCVRRYTNQETGEKFSKCYFPEGMTVGGQDMTGYYLNPKPEFIRPSGFRQGAMQWGYRIDPEKAIWAFKDVKNEDGTYGDREHVELDAVAIEEACREYMEAPEHKEFIRVDASRVKEHVNSKTGKTFFSAKGPNLTIDGVNLSNYELTANYHTAPKEVNGVETVIFHAVKGEKVKMNPPYGDSEAKAAYIPSETLAKGYNADIKRKATPVSTPEKEHAVEHATPAQAIAPTQVKNAPKQSR